MNSTNRRNHTTKGGHTQTSYNRRRQSGSQRILYDANGVRIKQSRFPQKLKNALLFFVLPYLVINGLIFFFVTATPDVDISVKDTSDYQTTQVEFKINTILPVKELTVQMESEPLEYTETGRNSYICDVYQNGMVYVTVKSINGMQTNNYVNVSVLDDTAPSIDEESCVITGGNLTFTISDSQSGVDFESIYGIYDGGKEVKPTRIDQSSGSVTIPMYSDSIELHFEDMVGNARMGTISSSMDYNEEGDSEEGSETEAASEETSESAGAEAGADEEESSEE